MADHSQKHQKGCWNAIGVWGFGAEKCEKLTEYVHCRNCPIFSQAGNSVFDGVPPVGYLSIWRKNIAVKNACDISRTKSVLLFRVMNEWFALPANILNEVALNRTVHRIPRSLNDFISGVVNINGEIRLSYSLKNLLTIKELNADHEYDVSRVMKRLIVIELDAVVYVFPVDEVSGLHWYAANDLLPVPATLEAEHALLLSGVIAVGDRQIAVFDIGKLQERLEGVSQ